MINRVDREHGRSYAVVLKLAEGLRHKAAAHFVAIGGIKGRERQNVQL
jgi:hypothetical protein